MGCAYHKMRKYSDVLSSYERAVAIQQQLLPPNHPDLAASYNNIGNVHADMRQYSQALSSHEKALAIRQHSLPSTHPDLASTYNNIGNVYYNINDYHKARTFYKYAVEIAQRSLPSYHPDLQNTVFAFGSEKPENNDCELSRFYLGIVCFNTWISIFIWLPKPLLPTQRSLVGECLVLLVPIIYNGVYFGFVMFAMIKTKNFAMSEEIKENVDVESNDYNQQDEQSKEMFRKVSITDDEEEEDELPLSTPNGRETPSATSVSDVIIQKRDEQLPISKENHTFDDTQEFLQIISDKSNKEATTTILNMLVDGDFDLDKNYIIQKPQNLSKLFSIFNKISSSLQAEILSVLIGIMRKSERNILACIDANIYDKLFEILNDIDNIVADLLVDILTVLTSLTINVNQLKLLLRYLKTENNIWKKHSVKLLHIFKSFPLRHGPDEFFNFPGRNDSGLVLPPIKTWPYQNGFTISTWFRIDPVANSIIEKEKPYLYWFCTSKGHGYTAHFVGNCLVISYTKPKEKNFQHCIQFEFKSREVIMMII
ncbi:unnamed protein product [Rotaria sordida]|uniref:Neurobeachin alpha-solenoid region domain-containing protein n=1 Tax=Rotaria sordida TaxID=392033 RepID=A0A819FEU9_9BILA|nr:unnamed protein product [Rotaria sordida]